MKETNDDIANFKVESLKRKGSLASRVASQLESRIRSGEIALHSKLPTETALCDLFGVSRTVIREAITNLKSIGLVDTKRGVGTSVISNKPKETFFADNIAPTTVEEILNILELRMSFEVRMAELAAVRRESDNLENIKQSLEAFDTAVEQLRLGRREDFEFHRSIAAAAKNPYFLALYDQLSKNVIPRTKIMVDGVDQKSTKEYLEKIQQEHLAIYRAIEQQDSEGAAKAMHDHLYRAYHMYEQYREV